MDIVIIVLCLSVLLLGLAIFSNRARASQVINFELTPNCLLTRWPLLFVTGPRSLFYFSSYWNSYTSFLAEHGYEVFTLHLPWSDPSLRRERFTHFLDEQDKALRHFHLFLDQATLEEFEDVIRKKKSSALRSLTTIKDQDTDEKRKKESLTSLPLPSGTVDLPSSFQTALHIKATFLLHKYLLRKRSLPSLSTLGATQGALDNGRLLLERAQTLAEMDLREDS